MNKAVILLSFACVAAIVVMNVSSQYYYGGYYRGAVNGQATAYKQYLAQLERYNNAQQLKTLTTATRGLRNSALVSLASLFAISLFATNSTGTLAG
ncbi:hypothetical protein FSP39_012172 [Pinctada imbricata]|uniref:Uncharacterized protein n=1 Tax=Pinctada imbricata TaxID=66713 RepID=A0AA88XUE1_PINIB|nr:hypothetical protein FSP39_012172 [Pinctada imbricata]